MQPWSCSISRSPPASWRIIWRIGRNLRHESTARADHRRRAEQPRVAAANPQGGVQPLLCQRGRGGVGRRGASRAGTYPAGRAHARHGWLRSVPPAQGRSGSRRDPGALYHRERQRRQREPGVRGGRSGLYLQAGLSEHGACPGAQSSLPGAPRSARVQLSHRHRHAERGGPLQRHRHRGAYLAHGRIRPGPG